MIRLCAFSDEAGSSLQAQIDALHRNGIGLMEIRMVDGENIANISLEQAAEIQKVLKDNQIQVWSLGSPLGKVSMGVFMLFNQNPPDLRPGDCFTVRECPSFQDWPGTLPYRGGWFRGPHRRFPQES